MANLKLACVLLVLCIVVSAPITEQAITCSQVVSSLTPCLSYLQGNAPQVPKPCCSGVNNLNNVAKSTADRRAACNCMKQAAGNVKNFNANRAAGLPKTCGVNIPYKISASTDCNTVQ